MLSVFIRFVEIILIVFISFTIITLAVGVGVELGLSVYFEKLRKKFKTLTDEETKDGE